MPKFAYFDHTEPAPQRVRGWYDTDARAYPNLPNAANLLQVTDTQWAARMSDPSGWAVDNGVLLPKRLAKPPQGPTSITIPKSPAGK
jgi:hypothetical protein